MLEPREPGLEVLEVSDELLGRAGEPRARLHVVLDGGDAGGAPAATTRRRLDLGRRDPRHEAQGREHLHVLLVEGRDLADRLLAGLGEVEEDAEAEVLPEGEIPAGPGRGLAVSVERALGHGRGAAADRALDPVTHHEVEPAPTRAHDGLPALHGPVDGARDQRELAQLVAAIRDGRGQRVVLAVMRERLLVERPEDDLDLLLEQLAVGLGVEHRGAEGLDLAGVVAAAHAEDHPAARQDVGGGEVLGQAQGVPHRRDVERAADADPRRHVGQMHRRHEDVRQALVPLVLEMVLGQPDRVIAEVVHGPRHGLRLLEDRREVLVGIAPLVGRRGALPHVGQIHVAGVHRGELVDHGCASRLLEVDPLVHGEPLEVPAKAVEPHLDRSQADPLATAEDATAP